MSSFFSTLHPANYPLEFCDFSSKKLLYTPNNYLNTKEFRENYFKNNKKSLDLKDEFEKNTEKESLLKCFPKGKLKSVFEHS